MDQWLGRMAPAVILPDSLSDADMLAVARKHFPEIPDPYLKLISSRAMQSEGYLKNMELCAARARWLAGERGRATPNKSDVEEAIVQMMPAVGMGPLFPSEPGKGPRQTPAKPLQPARSAAAAPLQAGSETQFSRPRALPIGDARAPVLTG